MGSAPFCATPEVVHRSMSFSWSKAAWVTLCCALVYAPTAGWADPVPGPPDNCPDGTEGQGSHCGQTCEPRSCSKNSDCPGQRCEERHFCVREESCHHRGGSFKVQNVSATCAAGGSCGIGACAPLRVCVTGPAPTTQSTPSPSQESSRSGCQAAGRPSGAPAALLAIGLYGLSRKRLRKTLKGG